jgi:hypothetical protein
VKATKHSTKSAFVGARWLAFATGLLLLAGIVAAAPAALAAPPVNFAGPGTGAGQVELPSGVAVDQSSGIVYIVDRNAARVDEFDSTGHFLRAFGWGVLNSAAELQVCTTACEAGLPGSGRGQLDKPVGVAVDQSSHDVYVTDGATVEEFNPAGEFILMFVGPGQLSSLWAMAFDASGNLWVGDENRLERFSPEGVFLSELPLPGAGPVYSLAIDTDPLSLSYQDFYILSKLPAVTKLNPAGEAIATIDGAGHPNAFGIDPASGDLFVSDQLEPETHWGTATLLEFDPSGAQTEAFGFPQVIGHPGFNTLAFGDTAQRLYVVSNAPEPGAAQIFAVPAPGPLPVEGSTHAREVRKTTASLCSKLNPESSSTTFHYQYIAEEQFVKDGNSFGASTLETSESALVGEGFAEQEGCQALGNLTPGTAYRFRVVAKNANGTVDGEPTVFQTLPPVAIDSTSVTDVAATSATLRSEINPLGDATSYRFEYISEAASLRDEAEGQAPFAGAVQVPLEAAAIGAGETDVTVAQHLDGLVAHTAYRYRVVAFNTIVPAGYIGSTLTFTTQSAGAFVLPDGRQWELVSPPDKHGSKLETQFGAASPFQAATAGDAVTYHASFPTEAEPQNNANGAQVLSTRGPAGWSSRDVGPPYAQATGSNIAARTEFRFFSADLSLAAMHPQGGFDPLISPEASEQTSYLRANFPVSDPADLCSEACFHPFVTGAEGFADVPAGVQFSTTEKCRPPELEAECGPVFRGATSDLAHAVLQSRLALTATALPAKASYGLYEWSGVEPPAERLRLVSVLPDGEPAVAPVIGGEGGIFGTAEETRGSAISADGSRVFFHDQGGHFYLRYNATRPQSALDGSGKCVEAAMACTVQLDAVQGGSGSGNVKASFQAASGDGSVVYFSDGQRLTVGSGASNRNPDLYRCLIVEAAGGLRCELSDLTPESSAAEQASVRGAVLGVSSDGSSAYFVANGVLTGTEHKTW